MKLNATKTTSLIKRLLATLALFTLSFSPLVSLAAGPSATVLDLPRIAEWLANNAKETLVKGLQASLTTSIVNLLTFTADRAAYDAAIMIASGGDAGESLYDGTPVEIYFKEVSMAVAGEALSQLDENFTGPGTLLAGFNICAPRSPKILLNLKLGIKGTLVRPEPNCDVNAVVDNWRGYLSSIQEGLSAPVKSQMVIAKLAEMYNPNVNEFSAGLEIYTNILGKTAIDAQILYEQRLQNGPFKDAVNFLTGNVETPAEWLEHEIVSKNDQGQEVRQDINLSFLANGDLYLQTVARAASVFTSTILSTYQKKLFDGWFKTDNTRVDPFNPSDLAVSNLEDARNQFRSLLAIAPLSVSDYSILGEFSSCTDTRGLYNCVMNDDFVSAVARADSGSPLTVKDAIESGLLKSNWPLIPESDASRNQDPFCYTYGFCYSNLVKLRKARIIPVGWEIAANSPFNRVESPVTLQEVIDNFDNCGSEGVPTESHPWCHLVDPDWVLKYPDTQCKAQVSGQILQTAGAADRLEECVDMPSCIAEDENGNCIGGYGYCVAEENVWEFRGESCPEYYASCQTFDGPEGTVSYLTNTVDAGNCNESNAGCAWYSTQKTQQSDGTFAWDPIADVDALTQSDNAYLSRIYFNDNITTCDSDDASCRQLISRSGGISLNLVSNPSFETDSDSNSVADSWFVTGAVNRDTTGSVARSGVAAIDSPDAILYQPGLSLSQSSFYTLSFYARQPASGTGSGQVLLALTAKSGESIDLSGTSASSDCTFQDGDSDGRSDLIVLSAAPAGTDYERFTCTFTSPTLDDPSTKVDAYLDLLAGGVVIDDVQLEQGANPTDFKEGYGTSDLDYLVAKVAPDYLGCTGSDSDPVECGNYARVCSENDVGCSAYSPVNGDPTITGVIDPELDSCPAECSGYDAFKQEPTNFETDGVFPVYFIPDSADSCSEEYVGCEEFTNVANEDLAYFTALRSCLTTSQAAANSASDNEATFYTWEGSDRDGYQLKTWSLLESNWNIGSTYTYDVSGETDRDPGRAPCTNYTVTESGITCDDISDRNGDGVYDFDSETCDEHDDIFTNPDCREFYDADGNIHYRSFANTVTVSDSCSVYRQTTVAGNSTAEKSDNCTNSGGYFDTTVGECRYFALEEESDSCPESANGCREYSGGRSRNSRVVFEDTFEGGDLTNWDAEAASGFATLSNESLAVGGHSLQLEDFVTTFQFDNGTSCSAESGCDGEANALGGTCTVLNGERYCGTLVGELSTGKTYTISFMVKGTSGSLNVGFDFENEADNSEVDLSFGTVSVDSSWQQVNLGPLDLNSTDYPNFGDGTTLVFDPASGQTVYIDNFVLREGEDNVALIKDSWVTPASCDQTPEGATSPQYYLGCQEYSDANSDSVFAYSFSRLCNEEDVGCQSFYQTQESASPHAEVFGATCYNFDNNDNGLLDDVAFEVVDCYWELEDVVTSDRTSPYLCTIGIGQTSCSFNLDNYVAPEDLPSDIMPGHISYGPSTVIVPSDLDRFLVINDDVTCDSGTEGCTEVGRPLYLADRNSTSGAESTYLQILPDDFADTLCSHADLFCAAFTTDSGTSYFKDPLDQTCEYREDVSLNGTNYSGWFRTDTDDFCYGTCTDGVTACGSDADCSGSDTCSPSDPSYLVGGTLSGVWRNGDSGYRGWVASCDESYSSCTEFEDPLGGEEGSVYAVDPGESYVVMNNDALQDGGLSDSQKCNGQVSLKDGCALFADTGLPNRDYNASASEISSRHADLLFGQTANDLVDPVDCEDASSVITLPDGTTYDPCVTRCVYDLGEVNNLTDGTSYIEKLREEQPTTSSIAINSGLYSAADLYLYGTSCYQPSDCAPVRSQSGELIEAIQCASSVRSTPEYSSGSVFDTTPGSFDLWLTGLGSSGKFESVERLQNDTNTVLKVDRNRECGEWLACANTQTVWDENSASYKTVCSDVELCTEYSAAAGSTFCSEWKFDSAASVFDDAFYAARDTSWYGLEYSGYAIPGLFPVQTLSQADVSEPTGVCDYGELTGTGGSSRDGGSVSYDASECDNDSDCVAEDGTQGTCSLPDSDYRLVYNAGTDSCNNEVNGTTCNVGACADTGASCSSNSDCSTGADCLVGQCYDVSANYCSSSSDCAEGQTCYNALCADINSDVSVEDYNANPTSPCAGSLTYVSDTTKFKTGTCINEQCLLTPTGQTFATDTSEGKLCRGYPENNSPFSAAVVTDWLDTATRIIDDEPTSGIFSTAYRYLSNYDAANTCAFGEDCDCTYTKVTYGQGTAIKYIDDETVIDSTLGICSGGDNSGASCSNDSECGTDGLWTCDKPSKEDTLVGLNGFCLEKDMSININGDRSQNACVTWLPVDQLAGDSDLYGKATSAGYNGGEVSYCANLKLYADVRTSDTDNIACAERDQDDGSAHTACVPAALTCPIGFYAVVGHYKDSDHEGQYQDQCLDGSSDNDCPFICVPENSRPSNNDSVSCDPDDSDFDPTVSGVLIKSDSSTDSYSREERYGYQFDAFFVDDVAEFEAVVTALKNCTDYGREYSPVTYTTEGAASTTGNWAPFSIPSEHYDNTECGNANCGWYNYTPQNSLYLGCSDYAIVDNDIESGIDYAATPWTNRLWSGGENYTLPGITDFSFNYDTDPVAFGNSGSPSAINSLSDPRPVVPVQCVIQDGENFYFSSPDENGACPDDGSYTPYSDSVEARMILQALGNMASNSDPGNVSYEPSQGSLTDEFAANFIFADSTNNGAGIVLDYETNFSYFNDLLSGIYATVTGAMHFSDGTIDDDGNPLDIDEMSDGRVVNADLPEDSNPANVWDVRAENGNPPTIWSLDTVHCDGAACEEGRENYFTINDSDTGDQGANSFFRAVLKFYAAADKNQLPLRRIIIDWQDRPSDDSDLTGSNAADNFYKNARGLQDGTTQSKCELNTEWGLTDESCDPNYLSYSHIYTCDAEILANTCDDSSKSDAPCALDLLNSDGLNDTCYFQPRLHIRDNWGFCTGVCDIRNDSVGASDLACFDSDGISLDSRDGEDECNYNIYPAGNPDADPWIYYDGFISVTAD